MSIATSNLAANKRDRDLDDKNLDSIRYEDDNILIKCPPPPPPSPNKRFQQHNDENLCTKRKVAHEINQIAKNIHIMTKKMEVYSYIENVTRHWDINFGLDLIELCVLFYPEYLDSYSSDEDEDEDEDLYYNHTQNFIDLKHMEDAEDLSDVGRECWFPSFINCKNSDPSLDGMSPSPAIHRMESESPCPWIIDKIKK